MPTQNKDVSDIFYQVANLLDIQGDNQFRIRAYRNAARIISGLPVEVSEMISRGDNLTELDGIGKDLAAKIKEIVQTGKLSQLEKLAGKKKANLGDLMKVDSLGPKRVKALYQSLGVSDLASLKKAAENGEIQKIKGFGEKTEKTILAHLKHKPVESERIKLRDAEKRAEALTDYLKASHGIKKVTIAGSFRRRKETVGDLDILVTCKNDSDVMKRFRNYEDVRKVIAKGKTKSSIVLRSGLQIDLRVVPEAGYGAALHYFTGSKDHNIAVRKMGVKKNLKINEYGVFKDDDRIAGRTEEEVFKSVGLPFIEPELRENQGEIEAAKKDRLPQLVRLEDMRGDLHAHTKATDGHATLEEMARAAAGMGYGYLAITEHSKRVSVAGGLDADELRKAIKKIDHLNERLEDLVILKSAEVDILKKGDLDLPDDVLKELDLTVCSVHYHRNLSRDEQTDRIIRAMDNPYFNILAHPTGRLINERSPYEVDMEKIISAAKERDCILEINAHPDRLDLTDRYSRMAREVGVKMAISTDAHSVADLNFMKYGVYQARRGWLSAADVVNTRNLDDLLKLFKRK